MFTYTRKKRMYATARTYTNTPREKERETESRKKKTKPNPAKSTKVQRSNVTQCGYAVSQT